jgi:multicomponent Na+:H+ antiporter subunit C
MMSTFMGYELAGVALVTLGLYAFIVHAHLLRKILAINVTGSGVFLILVALAARAKDVAPDPVPHAMVITGIVVAVSSTALALALMLRLYQATGRATLTEKTNS